MPFRVTRFSCFLAVLALGAAACTPAPPTTVPQPAATGAYPFQSATFNSVLRWDSGPTISARYWISPQGLLKEATSHGKVTFVLRRGGKAYQWDAGSHEGEEGSSSGDVRILGEPPDTVGVLRILPDVLKPANCSFLSYEKVEGSQTLKYAFRYRDPKFHAFWEGTVWLLPDRVFPVQFVNRGVGGRYQIVNSRMVFDSRVAPEFFEPPSDVHFNSVDIHRTK